MVLQQLSFFYIFILFLNIIKTCEISDGVCLDPFYRCGPFQDCERIGSLVIVRPNASCVCVANNCESKSEEGICTNCTTGYALTENGRYCVSPMANCNIYYDVQPDTQCKVCNKGFAVSDASTCVNEISNCEYYNGTGLCRDCQLGYLLRKNGTLCTQEIQNCSIYNESDYNKCEKCQMNTYLSINKTKCAKYILNCISYNDSGSCLKCAINYTPSISGMICAKNIENCENYSDKLGICLNCTINFRPTENGVKCAQYLPNCFSYDDSSLKCKQCNLNFFLENDACYDVISNCKNYTADFNFCSICEDNYNLTNDKKKCIKNILYCKIFDNNGNCSECIDGYNLSSTRKKCIQNIKNCVNFGDDSLCINCISNYNLSMSRVRCCPKISQCLNYSDESDICLNCFKNYKSNKNGTICFKEITNCSIHNENNFTCDACNNSYVRTKLHLKCVSNINNCLEYEDDSGMCSSCKINYQQTKSKIKCVSEIKNCLEYDDLTEKCDKCKNGSEITPEKECIENQISDNKSDDNNSNLIIIIVVPVCVVAIIFAIVLFIYCKKKKPVKKESLLNESSIPSISIYTTSALSTQTISIGTAIKKIGEFIENEKLKLEHFVFEIIESDESFSKQTQIKLLEKIGKGGFGKVYRGKDFVENNYAMKIFLDKDGSDVLTEQDLYSFKEMTKEKLHLRDMKHENIISLTGVVYCFKPEKLILGIVEPFMQFDLKSFLKAKGNVLTFDRRMEIALNIAKGLNYMHYRKCSHNDIKPQNILINWELEMGKIEVKLSDFGTVQKAFDPFQENLGITLEYAAPERILKFYCQIELTKEILIYSDIWSYGCVLIKIFKEELEEKLFFPWSPLIGKNFQNLPEHQEEIRKVILEEEKINNHYFADKKIPIKIEKIINDCLQVDFYKRPKIEKLISCLK